jgi:hypothetical protein
MSVDKKSPGGFEKGYQVPSLFGFGETGKVAQFILFFTKEGLNVNASKSCLGTTFSTYG